MIEDFTKEEFNLIFDNVSKQFTKGKLKVENAKVIFLCGQPGSGKANLKNYA